MTSAQLQTLDAIRQAAYAGELPDSNLPMPDRVLWWSLLELYGRFRDGKITQAEGERFAREIQQQYDADYSKHDLNESLIAAQAKMWQSVETAATEYAAERTIEHADKFWEAVYGCKLKREEVMLG